MRKITVETLDGQVFEEVTSDDDEVIDCNLIDALITDLNLNLNEVVNTAVIQYETH
jgi:hypothetical protein